MRCYDTPNVLPYIKCYMVCNPGMVFFSVSDPSPSCFELLAFELVSMHSFLFRLNPASRLLSVSENVRDLFLFIDLFFLNLETACIVNVAVLTDACAVWTLRNLTVPISVNISSSVPSLALGLQYSTHMRYTCNMTTKAFFAIKNKNMLLSLKSYLEAKNRRSIKKGPSCSNIGVRSCIKSIWVCIKVCTVLSKCFKAFKTLNRIPSFFLPLSFWCWFSRPWDTGFSESKSIVFRLSRCLSKAFLCASLYVYKAGATRFDFLSVLISIFMSPLAPRSFSFSSFTSSFALSCATLSAFWIVTENWRRLIDHRAMSRFIMLNKKDVSI